MSNFYATLTSSLIKYVEAFRCAYCPSATYVDWDEHADITSLPEGDLCGPAGLGFTQEDATINAAFSFGIATVDDLHLFRLRAAMGALHQQLQPQTRIPLFNENGDTGHFLLVKTPVIINPISKAQVRSIQFIQLLGAVDFGALSSC